MPRRIDELKRRIKKVNAMILNTRKRYGNDSQIVRRIDATIQRIYRSEDKHYYSLPSDAGLQQLNMIDRGLFKVENSLYTSRAGREELIRKAKETFRGNDYFSSLGDSTIEQLWDLFQSDTWSKIREIANMSSDLVVDDIAGMLEDNGIDKVKNILDEYLNAPNNDETILDFLNQMKGNTS